MQLSIEQLQANSHIPTTEIEQDIRDTQREIESMQEELQALRNATHAGERRLRTYLLEGRIAEREEFIDHLNQLLNYRKAN